MCLPLGRDGLIAGALTMYKSRAYDVQTQADTAHDHDKPRILDACGLLVRGTASVDQSTYAQSR